MFRQLLQVVANDWRERSRGWFVCPSCMISLVPRFGCCSYCARRATTLGIVYPRARSTIAESDRDARVAARLVILFGAAELVLTLEDVAALRIRAGLG